MLTPLLAILVDELDDLGSQRHTLPVKFLNSMLVLTIVYAK